MLDDGAVVRVRPRESLVRTGLVASVVGGVPLLAVLYWLSLVQGSWRRVLVVHVLAVVVLLLAWLRHRGSFAEVTRTHLIKQAFFRRRVVEREQIASAIIVHTWRAGSSDAVPQLLIRDAAESTLVRFRGAFWSMEAMETIAHGLQVPVTIAPETMTLPEFYAEHPHSAYWYEGRLWVTVAGVVVAFAGAFLVMSWIMLAIGAPGALGLVP